MSAGGTITQLVALGAENAYLTGGGGDNNGNNYNSTCTGGQCKSVTAAQFYTCETNCAPIQCIQTENGMICNNNINPKQVYPNFITCQQQCGKK